MHPAGKGPGLADQGNDDIAVIGDEIWLSRFDTGDLLSMPVPA
jgi:hypothetical protein